MNKTEIKKELREVSHQRQLLSEREAALEALLATYQPSGNGHGNPSTAKKRTYQGRKTKRDRMYEVLEFLRTHPDEEFTARGVSKEVEGLPDSSTRVAFETLTKSKEVTVTEWQPLTLKYKPVKFKGN